MLRLGVSGAAMFAEPAVTKIEEVVGLVHGENSRGRACPCPCCSSASSGQRQGLPLQTSFLPRNRSGQAHRHGYPPVVSKDLQLHRIADLMLVEQAVKIVRVRNLLAVHAQDNVSDCKVAIRFASRHADRH